MAHGDAFVVGQARKPGFVGKPRRDLGVEVEQPALGAQVGGDGGDALGRGEDQLEGVLGVGAAAAAVGFMVWEGVKVLLTVAMLVAAAKVVPDLSWPALLAALTVCLSMNWLALLWQGRRQNKSR